eukprot:CAMPEP_0115196156 /NCGR_PEP_ID=MMETSP0270-20121206/14943_1 /TAXON_ID=71861 /ORGANISM="Scrippsiella trochoidea, Strain CCMP3099" /LENGTH=931 /DNA_ID=CAMNT_0002609485 /DNA_START=75 /DNA_END=2870 /DNA_ORIENTATION=+
MVLVGFAVLHIITSDGFGRRVWNSPSVARPTFTLPQPCTEACRGACQDSVFWSMQGAVPISDKGSILCTKTGRRRAWHIQDVSTRPQVGRLIRPRCCYLGELRSSRVCCAATESAPNVAVDTTPLDFEIVALLAGFSFETYNTPDTVRWERGEDGLNVALLSDDFVPSVYKGVLSVKLIAVEDLREDTGGVVEKLTTGSRSDPYVLLNIIEDGQTLLSQSIIATGSINEARVKQSLDVKRSSTLWRGGGEGRTAWQGEGDGEVLRLYLKDPSAARLGIRVLDENIAVEDRLLGASEMELNAVLANGNFWTGKVPLVYKEKDWDWGAGAAGLAASAFTGLATGGASLAVGAAAMVFKAVTPADQVGSLEVRLEYQTLESVSADSDADAGVAGRAPVGATPGVDWSELGRAVGGIASMADSYDFLGFVSNDYTSTEAGLWRNKAQKHLILAFRGTVQTDIQDLMTDVNIVKTPWASRDEGDPIADDEPLVHAGFRKALDSVSQRLKALIREAVAGVPEDWEIFITGHSLGGALATLMALDLGGGLDASKGLPVAPKRRLWISELIFGKEEAVQTEGPPKFKRLSLYTFGAPRVGNAAFAAALEAAVPEAYRIVNSQDLVARFPRGFYQHGGRTVLLLNTTSDGLIGSAAKLETADGLWVEGQSQGKCPLRDDAVLRSPLDKESLLGDMYTTFEQGPLAALSAVAGEASEAAAELRSRLGSASGAARQELQELAESAEASVMELRRAGERAATFGDRLAEAYKGNASKEELQQLEAQSADAVAKDLERALVRSRMLGEASGRLSRAVDGALRGGSQAVAGSEGVREAAAVLSSAETTASSAIQGVAEAFAITTDKLKKRMSTATFGELASIIGIDASYADSEVQLLKAISTGQAIVQHLEPSYYEAMWSVVRARAKNSMARVKELPDAATAVSQ